MLNVSTCTLGSPAAVSFPHFLYADNFYLNNIQGLNPNPREHMFYMDFENVRIYKLYVRIILNIILMFQTLGIPLNIAARMQINIVLEQNDNLEFSQNRTEKVVYFPQFWFSVVSILQFSNLNN